MLSVPLFLGVVLGCTTADPEPAAPPPAPEAAPEPSPAPSPSPKRTKSPRDRGKHKGRKGKGKAAPGSGPTIDADCAVGAYLTPGDKAVPVFEGPERGPKAGSLRADHYYTHLVVSERKGDWMRIGEVDVRIAKEGDGGPLSVEGWVTADHVSIQLEACHNGTEELFPRLYAQPDLGSRVFHRYDDNTAAAEVVGCADTWWRVRDAQGHDGWVPEGMWCDHAQTNCLRQCKQIKR